MRRKCTAGEIIKKLLIHWSIVIVLVVVLVVVVDDGGGSDGRGMWLQIVIERVDYGTH